MKRQDLEKYLGKTVTVDIGAGRFFTGCLRKCGDERFKNDPNLYIPRNFYFLSSNVFYFLSSNVNAFDCVSWIFRCSHVKKIKLLN